MGISVRLLSHIYHISGNLSSHHLEIYNNVETNCLLDMWIKSRNYDHLIDCESLFQKNNTQSRERATNLAKTYPRKPINDLMFINITKNCTEFKTKRGYSSSVTFQNFSIAYIILFYKELEQLEFLLRSIYRPNNVYCLHPDNSSSWVGILIFIFTSVSILIIFFRNSKLTKGQSTPSLQQAASNKGQK